MMKKQFWFFVLILILSGCHKENQTANIVFWSSNNAQEIDFVSEYVKKWNVAHSSNPIHSQPIPEGQSSEEIILASVVGKTTPDIYANMWQGSIEMYAKAKVLVPLDTLKGFMDFIRNRCDSSVIHEITSADGHIYQIPWKVNPIMTIYNKDLIANLSTNANPLLTYNDYYAAGKAFKKDLNHDGYLDQWLGYTEVKAIWYQRLFNFYPLYLAASGGLPLIKNHKAAFNNIFAIEVFRFLQNLYKNEYFSKEKLSSGRDPFISQHIALKFSGPWEINYLEKFKDPNFNYDFKQMPVPVNHTGPIYTYCDPKNIVIFNTCKNPQVAWEFVKTMLDKKGDLRLMQLTAQFPRRKNLSTDTFFQGFLQKNPKLKPFAQQTKYIRGIDNCEVIVEVLDIISQEYEACVVYHTKTPELAIKDAEKAVNILLENQVGELPKKSVAHL